MQPVRQWERPVLPYAYEFTPDALQDICICTQEHGFAVVKGVLSQAFVEELKSEVRRVIKETQGIPKAGGTAASLNFIEVSPVMAKLLSYEPYMRIAHALYSNQPITLNRSAALYKQPGASTGPWHTDWMPLIPPYGCNAVLNNTGAMSNWFYLNGTHPERAGLAIIPDSHTEDWPGPQGFSFTDQQQSFYRSGTSPRASTDMDFAEVFPLFTDPGDLIIFAERTYHGVYFHHGTETRLSCGLSFRPKSYQIKECWPLPESTQRFIASMPAEVQPLLDGYTGIDPKWRYEG